MKSHYLHLFISILTFLAFNSLKVQSQPCFDNFNDVYQNYLPDAQPGVHTIRLNLNYFQKDDGSDNFNLSNPDHVDFLNRVFIRLNTIYSTIALPSDPVAGVQHIADSKIRFALVNQFEHPNTFFWSHENFGLNEEWKNHHWDGFGTNVGTTHNIYLFETESLFGPDQQANIGGIELFSDGGGISIKGTNIVNSFGQYRRDLSPNHITAEIEMAGVLAHELGHFLDLDHVEPKVSWPLTVGDGDGFSDTPDEINTGLCNPFASPSDNCSNNIMSSFSLLHEYISPMQMAKMRLTILTNLAVAKYTTLSAYDPALSVEVNTDAIWNFSKYISGDFDIKNASTISSSCNLWLVENSTTTLHTNSKLILEEFGFLHFDKNTTVNLEAGSELHLQENTLTELHQGGVLTLKSGSKLIVERSAEFIVHYGALIIVEEGAEIIIKTKQADSGGLKIGDNSDPFQTAELRVYGTIRVTSGGTFKHDKDGFISFKENGNMIFEDNAKFTIFGKSINDEILRIETNQPLVLESDQNIITDGKVTFGINSGLTLAIKPSATSNQSTNFVSRVRFTPITGQQANQTADLSFKGKSTITDSKIENLRTGLRCEGNTTISQTSFDFNQWGLLCTGISQVNLNVSNCTFFNNGHGVLLASLQQGAVNIENCTLNSNNYGVFAFRCLNELELNIKDCGFGFNNYGISARELVGKLTIENTTMQYNTIVGALFLLNDDVTIKGGEISNNPIGIGTGSFKYINLEDNVSVHHNTTGLVSFFTHVFVRGGTIFQDNTTAIRGVGLAGLPIIVSVGDDGSCGSIINNDTAITGENIYLDIDGIEHQVGTFPSSNSFENNTTFVDITYSLGAFPPIISTQPTLSILAKRIFFGNHSIPFGDGCTIPGANNPNDNSNFTYWQVDPFAVLQDPPILHQVSVSLDYTSPCVLGLASNCQCLDDVAIIEPFCPFVTPGNGTGGTSGLHRPVEKPNLVRPTPGRGRRINTNITTSTTTFESSAVEAADAVVESTFKESYAEFISKDYDHALPMLEEVTYIPFGKKRSDLSVSSQHKIRVAEILTDKHNLLNEDNIIMTFDSNFNMISTTIIDDGTSYIENNEETLIVTAYHLKAIPNPANGNFVAEYDLGNKTTGQIIIRDAITNLVMETIQLDSTQKSVQINVRRFPKGNYILELQGDNTYLKSEHLMVY